MITGKGPLGQSKVEMSCSLYKNEDTLFKNICGGLLILLALIGISGIIYIENNRPPKYYQLTTYNLDGSKTTHITTNYITNEFSGTYTLRLKDDRFVAVPIKNTNVIELEKVSK